MHTELKVLIFGSDEWLDAIIFTAELGRILLSGN
jgi:hypothetical protein